MDVFEFLIIFSDRNQSWGFPKGHIEIGENEKEAALREIDEEVGLVDLVFVGDFKVKDVYSSVSNRGESKGQKIEKHSVFFLVKARHEEIMLDGDEIIDYHWLPVEKAVSLLIFKSTQEVLWKAYNYFKELNNGNR